MATSKINPERLEIAKKRLRSVLGSHVIAISRTLEQKISDAGPFNQRVDPHVLTEARNGLTIRGEIRVIRGKNNLPWYHLREVEQDSVKQRMVAQQAVHEATQAKDFTMRVGQAAEIAVYRALTAQKTVIFLGDFPDIGEHDDSRLYTKEEPPSAINGRRLAGKKKLDFVLLHKDAGAAGIEIKNVREWMYPDREEVREMIGKCVAIDAVPILIARRIPYATFSVFNRCGIIIHQLYGQIYPKADEGLASQARDKRLLGYHDIRVGNQPDERLLRFVGKNLPDLIGSAREKFDQWKEELDGYAAGRIQYREFVAMLRGTYGEQEEAAEPGDWFPGYEDL